MFLVIDEALDKATAAESEIESVAIELHQARMLQNQALRDMNEERMKCIALQQRLEEQAGQLSAQSRENQLLTQQLMDTQERLTASQQREQSLHAQLQDARQAISDLRGELDAKYDCYRFLRFFVLFVACHAFVDP